MREAMRLLRLAGTAHQRVSSAVVGAAGIIAAGSPYRAVTPSALHTAEHQLCTALAALRAGLQPSQPAPALERALSALSRGQAARKHLSEAMGHAGDAISAEHLAGRFVPGPQGRGQGVPGALPMRRAEEQLKLAMAVLEKK